MYFEFFQQIQPTAADLSELQQSTSDQRHLQQTYQKLQQQLLAKTKTSVLPNTQQVRFILNFQDLFFHPHWSDKVNI